MNSNLACQYQEERREELIDGKIMMTSPAFSNHNRIAGNIYRIFSNFLHGRTCEPFGDGEIVYLTDKDHFIPDMMVVCDPAKVKPDGVYGTPDLVVEILSPSTAKNDKGYKKDVYEASGVTEYWIVSPGEKSVDVYRTDGTKLILHNIYTLYPDWALARMSENERAALETHFKCCLFDDLDIPLEDIFYRTF